MLDRNRGSGSEASSKAIAFFRFVFQTRSFSFLNVFPTLRFPSGAADADAVGCGSVQFAAIKVHFTCLDRGKKTLHRGSNRLRFSGNVDKGRKRKDREKEQERGE